MTTNPVKPQKLERPDGTPPRVLVVDDEHNLTELLSMALRSHGLDVVVARPFNHIGPRQTMASAANQFAQQIAEIEAGLREPVLRVGNMTAQRDFTDVRDVARAYFALIRLGEPG